MMSDNPDPIQLWQFAIEIGNDPVAAFTECVLPNFEIETLPIPEGGQTGYTVTLPGPIKAGVITLKNGLFIGSKMFQWYLNMLSGNFDSDDFKQISLIVYKDGKQAFRFD